MKSIVSKFSRQEQSEQAEQPADGLVDIISSKRFKGPPVVKPKPRRASFPLQLEGQQAPPLPMKRSRRPKVLLVDAVSVKCGRSGECQCQDAALCCSVISHFHLSVAA